MWRMPVQALLVPDTTPPIEVPAGMALIDQPLGAGLPLMLALDAGWSLLLTLPTGQALRWREAEPTRIVATSADEERPAGRPAMPGYRPPLRLLVRRGDGQWIGAVALAAPGRAVVVPGDRAAPDAALVIVPLAWDVRAGNLVGPGDWGGRVRLAWRRAGVAGVDYQPPALNPFSTRRLAGFRETEAGAGQDARALETARREWTRRRARAGKTP